MPEMPEVETIRRTLDPFLVGKRIIDVRIFLERLIKYPSVIEYKKRVQGQKITAVKRRGKYLILVLENGVQAIFHLRMTGQLRYLPVNTEAKYEKIVFSLDDGNKLSFADMRTFGTLYAIYPEEIDKISGLHELGPEPLSPEFTGEYLYQLSQRKHGQIKPFLLNQKYVAGLGNIYVDEALFLAHIQPTSNVKNMTLAQAEDLKEAINKVIAAGIKDGGTTFSDYVNGLGEKGAHQKHLWVYGRGKEKCRRCQSILVKTKVGGRGTTYCPHCQKLL